MTLRLAAIPGATPDKWLQRWRQRFPQIRIAVDYYDDGAPDGSDQLHRVAAGLADLGYLRLPAGEVLTDERFYRVRLYEELPVVCAAAEHWVAAAEDTVSWEDIAEEAFLDPTQMAPIHVDPSAAVHEPKAGGELAAAERMALEVAASGAGLLLLPNSVARALSRKDVVIRAVEGLPGYEVGLCWLKDRDDEVIQEFIGVARGRKAGSGRSELEGSTSGRSSGRPSGGRRQTGGTGGRTGGRGSQVRPGGARAGRGRPPRRRRPR
ncbi:MULTISPECIES: LysR family transcriptional regulator substrate-binding protein [Actinomycetes]|uniref:LysR family transcriptional regulator substrate-binding protein n=1 Tax=Actinomycetes TaxID=1760 RepID=UPI0031DC8358